MKYGYSSSLVDKMIFKVLIIKWIYMTFSMNSIASYVFFAANLDDFRTIAKKIIPGQLADQLADMASPSENPQGNNVREATNNQGKHYEESEYSDDKIKVENGDISDQYSDESDLETYKPLVIKSKRIPRKRYVIKNQRLENEKYINIDELVERVKEKLADEFQFAKTALTGNPISATENSRKLDEYYYKDDTLNAGLVKDDEYDHLEKQATITQDFTTERQQYEEQLSTEKIKDNQQYHDDNTKVKEIKNEMVDYDGARVRYASHANKGIERDLNPFDETENQVNQDYAGQVIKDIPEYYEEDDKGIQENNNANMKEQPAYNNANIEKVSDPSENPINNGPEYYRQEASIVQNNKEYNKEVEYNNAQVKQVSVYNNAPLKQASIDGESVKNVPVYYDDDDEKEIVQIDVGSAKLTEENNQDEVKDVPEYYEEDLKDVSPTPSNGDLFKEVDMLKKTNDSYEDYVVPKPDDIFESAEEQIQRPTKPKGIQKFAAANNLKYKLNKPKAIVDPVIKKKTVSYVMSPVKPVVQRIVPVVSRPPKMIIKKKQPVEIKGKTESMWYKDPNIENYDDSTKSTTPGNSTKKKGLNTMFPTRAHYKMSSPNYYAKLPVIVEKYNFNEPLPENDREPENIKHWGNPPAKINKKVRI